MKTLTPEDAAYLSGFIDADGSIFAQIIKNKTSKHKFHIRVTIQITQLTKRKFFLERILNKIDAGYIRERGEISDYVLTETKNVFNLLIQIKPFLILKKKQANLIILIIQNLPSSKNSLDKFIETCKMVDFVAKLNDSKKRKNSTQTVETVLTTLKSKDNVIVPVETSDKNQDGSSQ